jgi:hypothetical protein
LKIIPFPQTLRHGSLIDDGSGGLVLKRRFGAVEYNYLIVIFPPAFLPSNDLPQLDMNMQSGDKPLFNGMVKNVSKGT